jgi:tetratricopeptide (TPR) repeat protein
MCKQENDCRQALLLYDQAIDERGDSTELFKKRGMAHYALKEIELAIGDFSKAIELQKNEEKQDAALYYIRGLSKSLLEKEDRRGACEDLKKATALGWASTDESFDSWFAEYCSAK